MGKNSFIVVASSLAGGNAFAKGNICPTGIATLW